jgi:uncharacterized metal-binding protein YceD (DUF177 family)
MKKDKPEFSRPILVDRIPGLGSTEKLSADAAELVALAGRLGLPRLHGLSAVLRAEPWRRSGVKVSGQINADIDQACVVTLEDFRSWQTLPVLRFFLMPKDMPRAAEDSVDADADPIVDGEIDLGELVSETLALDLDPYPRKPGAAFDDIIEDLEKPSPFAALSKLKGGA